MNQMSTAALAALALLAHGAAQASRMLGTPTSRPASAAARQPAPALRSGVITAVRQGDPRGVQVQIDGQWWLVLNDRTAVLRNGALVDPAVLASGQKVRFLPASPTAGETALGTVHVP